MTVRQESGCAKGHNDEFLGYRRLENESDDFRGTKLCRTPSYQVTSLGGYSKYLVIWKKCRRMEKERNQPIAWKGD